MLRFTLLLMTVISTSLLSNQVEGAADKKAPSASKISKNPSAMTPEQLQELKRSYRGNIIAGSIIIPVGSAVGGIFMVVGGLKSLSAQSGYEDSESEKKRKRVRKREATLLFTGGAVLVAGSVLSGIYFIRKGKAQKLEYLMHSNAKEVQGKRIHDGQFVLSSVEPMYQHDLNTGERDVGLSLTWRFN